MVRRAPHPALASIVHGTYCGWVEHTAQGARRRELPTMKVPLILTLDGDPYRISSPGERGGAVHRSFVAGLWETYAVTASPPSTFGLQIDLTPLGAHRLLGTPMSELANRIIDAMDLLGEAAPELLDRLQHAPTWLERFDLLDDALIARAGAAPSPSASVEWAMGLLVGRRGRVEINALTSELGWSRKRLNAAFQEHLGLSPKTIARILRFDHAVERLRTCAAPRWTEVALECGFYDQSHLIRDFATFAGATPTELLGRRLPGLEAVTD
jgi:AraC-like DNA-binding protein